MKMHRTLCVSMFICICLCSIASAQSNPTLPQAWANNHECDPPGGVYDVTRIMGTDYTNNAAGLNKAISDWTAAADQWWHILVPHGSILQVTSQVTLLGKVGATKCLVFDSDTPLTSNQTVCSHKTIDNSDGSSPRNLGCTNDVRSMGTLEASWGSGNHGMLLQACTFGGAGCSVGPNHYAFKNLEMRFLHGLNTAKSFLVNLDDGDTTGNSGSSHIWFIQDFVHAVATDAGPGNNLVSGFVNFTSASYSGLAYDYMDECASNGNESHGWTADWSPGPLKIAHNWIEGC